MASPPPKHAPRVVPLTERGATTRDLILNEAEKLIGAAGLEAFDIGGLAVRAGVSRSTVYRYFQNRHQILAEIHPELANLENKVEQLRALGRESIPDGDKWQRVRQIFSLD